MGVKRLVAEICDSNDNVIMTVDDNLLSAEFGALDRGSITDVVDWGIYANRGRLSFIDNNGYFNDFNANSSEISNATVKFYLAKIATELIATFEVANVVYNNETKQVDIELQSCLLALQNNTIYNDIYIWSSVSIKEVLNYCFKQEINFGDGTSSLSDMSIYCTYIAAPINLWNIGEKICQISMCRIFDNKYGKPIISNENLSRSPIIIDTQNVISYTSPDFVKHANFKMDAINRKKSLTTTEHSTIRFNVYNTDGTMALTSPITVTEIADETYNGVYNCKVSANLSFPHKIFEVVAYGKAIGNFYQSLKNGNQAYLNNFTVDVSNISSVVSSDHTSVLLEFTIQGAKVIDSDVTTVLTEMEFSFSYKYFYDEGTKDYSTVLSDYPYKQITTNDLMQTSNRYRNDDVLADYIVNTTLRRYGKGIECVECECLFNNYYDINGNLVLNGSDLQHFEKYDIVIPYTVKKGQRVPFRTNKDGIPKRFRIIGIQYSYDGLLRQKLWLQEEQYNDIA